MPWCFLSHTIEVSFAVVEISGDFLIFQLDSYTTDRRHRHGLTTPVSNSIRTDESSEFTPTSRPGFSVLCSSSFCLLSSEQSQMIAVQPEIYLTSQR